MLTRLKSPSETSCTLRPSALPVLGKSSAIRAGLVAIERVIRRLDQCERVFLLLERSDHAQALERIRFEWLAAPAEVRGEASDRAFRRLDLPRFERVGEIECRIAHGLVRLHFRQWRYATVRKIVGILHELPQIAVRFTRAGGKTGAYRRDGDQPRRHDLPPFLSLSFLRCVA